MASSSRSPPIGPDVEARASPGRNGGVAAEERAPAGARPPALSGTSDPVEKMGDEPDGLEPTAEVGPDSA
jgi:hypothetical protein